VIKLQHDPSIHRITRRRESLRYADNENHGGEMIVQTFLVSEVLDHAVPAKGVVRPSGDRAIRDFLVFGTELFVIFGSARASPCPRLCEGRVQNYLILR
jgi:hypothetical protein